MSDLFQPLKLGAIPVPNRILMSPLTRARGTRDHLPTPIMADYYGQRAGAGLIISEATGISLAGLCWPFAPGIWNAAQIEEWKRITQRVHDKGGRIICQLWHCGRLVHPNLPGRGTPVSASATTAPGLAHTYEGKVPYTQARPLEVSEVPTLLNDYRQAALNAIEAGFDGAQLHAGNGYLIDQFLRDSSNLRQDEYGGPVAHRIRLLDEVVTTVADAIGAGRTSVRLSPEAERQGVSDSNPVPLFTAACESLSRIGIGFLEIRRSEPREAALSDVVVAMRRAFNGPLVLNGGYTFDEAQGALARGDCEAVSFGRPFIANPDLPGAFANATPLRHTDMSTWYGGSAEGYTEFP